MAPSDGISELLTPERKQILIASAGLFCISLGVLSPRWGISLGWLFTITGGVVGGILIGGLRRRGGVDGFVYGAYVGAVGGLASSIVGVVLGTPINLATFASETSITPSKYTIGGYVLIAIVGFVSGMVFKLMGASVAGALVGALLDARD